MDDEQRRKDRRQMLAQIAQRTVESPVCTPPPPPPEPENPLWHAFAEAVRTNPKPVFPYGAGALSYARTRQATGEVSRRIDELLKQRNDEFAGGEERAEAMLREFLNPRQRETYSKGGYFDVASRKTPGRYYRILREWAVNIEIRDGDEPCTALLCGGPAGVPLSDMLLGQKLWLEADELGFLARSRVHLTLREYFR